MLRVGIPLQCPELSLQPEPSGGVELSENMQQVLSLNTGFWRNQRVLLKSSPSGSLFTSSPQLDDIIHVTADEDSFVYQGTARQITEVMVMAHPDNAGRVWARTKVAATVNNAWPLAAGEVVSYTITNLSMLRLLIASDTEKAILAYTM